MVSVPIPHKSISLFEIWFFFLLNVVSHPCFPSVFPKFSLCYYSDLSCVIEVDHYGQFVRKARTKTCKASTDPVWDQVRGGKLDFQLLRLAALHPPLLALREYDVTVSDKCDRLAYLAGRGWVSGALYSFSNDERNNRFTLCCWNNVLCRLSVLKPSKSHLMGLAGQKFKIAARMVWLHPLSLGL